MDLLMIIPLNSQKNLHPHCPRQVLHPTTSVPVMKAIRQVHHPKTSAPMTNAIKMKRVRTMLHQKFRQPKRRWFGDKSWEIPRSKHWDSPTWQKCCPNCTTRTSFSQKTSSSTQFETFCFSTFDLPWCLYLFPTTWLCISWHAFECDGSYLGYKTCKGYMPKQQPCCRGKSDGCIMDKI